LATYGIDLGTTYSCIAHIDDAGRAVVIKNAVGEDTTPSVVYFETASNIVVGREAKNSAKISPELTVSLIKRQMGEKLTLEFHGASHSPDSISSLILMELARSASEVVGSPVEDVVITVPAYFGVAQRQATRNAGRIAGLNVIDVLSEPVAAALHYESTSTDSDRTIMVYDLGGGTFDTTVIQLSGNEVSVLCTDGDHQLGGADWDARIADHLLEQFMKEHPESTAKDSEDFLQELAISAEDLKKALSSMETRRHNMRFDGAVTKAELTRDTFEQLTVNLLERTFEITERTISLAKERGANSFDEVLLVGGSTRMPAVAAGLRARFGFEPKLHDPDLAVAKGAALYGLVQSVREALPSGAETDAGVTAEPTVAAVNAVADQLGIAPEQVRKLAEKKIVTVAPRAFGIKAMRGDDAIITHLLGANAPLPAAPPTQQFYTRVPNQTSIRLQVWEQAGSVESESLDDNEQIGEGFITDMPPLAQGSPIDVTFQMETNGTLRVHAVELSSGKDLNMEIRIAGLSAEDVDVAREAMSRYTVGS
jgi:molecular chaperone DnaK